MHPGSPVTVPWLSLSAAETRFPSCLRIPALKYKDSMSHGSGVLGWLQCPVAFKRPCPGSCHFPSTLGRDGMGPLRPSCDSDQGCTTALLHTCQEQVLEYRSEQAAGMGASVLQVSKLGRRTLGGQWGGHWGQRGHSKVGVCGLDMKGTLRVPLRPLGTVWDLRKLGLRSPLAP